MKVAPIPMFGQNVWNRISNVLIPCAYEARNMFLALRALKLVSIVHSDLKPDNLLVSMAPWLRVGRGPSC